MRIPRIRRTLRAGRSRVSISSQGQAASASAFISQTWATCPCSPLSTRALPQRRSPATSGVRSSTATSSSDPEYPDADLIVGGPPCQGFSPLGRDRDDLSRAQLNGLWKYFLDAVRTIRPKAFVIENVREFQRSAEFAELIRLLKTDSELKAYTPAFGVLNAADYGVPQIRHRGILVAVRDHDGEPAVASCAAPGTRLGWMPAPTSR